VLQLCNKVIWMERGSVRGAGKARDMVEAYMESLYEDKQGSVRTSGQDEKDAEVLPDVLEEAWYDARSEYLKTTDVRNEIELYRFDGGSRSFGSGLVKIENAFFLLNNGKKANFIIGG